MLLLTPLFGCTLFWRLHYLVFRDATARFEEWFCAAEHTAAIALAVAPTPRAVQYSLRSDELERWTVVLTQSSDCSIPLEGSRPTGYLALIL